MHSASSSEPVQTSVSVGAVSVSNFPATQAVSGPVTDAQLRAAAVPVSGPVTDAQIRATPVPVSGPVTDAQIRATPVPVSGPVTDAQMRATPVPVTGPTGGLPVVAADDFLARVYTGEADFVTVSGAPDVNGHATSVPVATPTNAPLACQGERPLTALFASVSAPTNGQVCLDTGQLGAGDYEIWAEFGSMEGNTTQYGEMVHRNAANNGDVVLLAAAMAANTRPHMPAYLPRYTIAANERLVWRNSGANATAATLYWYMIRYRKVA